MWSRKRLVTIGVLAVIALGWWWTRPEEPQHERPPASGPETRQPLVRRQPQPLSGIPREPQPSSPARPEAPGYTPSFSSRHQAPPQGRVPSWGGTGEYYGDAPQRSPRFRPLTERERQRMEAARPYEPPQGAPTDPGPPSWGYGGRPDQGFRRPDRPSERPIRDWQTEPDRRDEGYREPAPAFGPPPWPNPWPTMPPERYPQRHSDRADLHLAS